MLLLIAVEGALLTWWHRRTGRGVPTALSAPFLAAGAAFVVALYFQRRPSGALGFAIAMLAALLFHVLHLRQLARHAPRR